VCDIKPLEGESLARYYVPLEARVNATYGIQIMLEDQEPGEFAKVLFTGHVGCGKSSELAKIARNEEASYRIIYVQAEEQADPYDLEYTDLYLGTSRK
jgi:ABC-type nitrate/sulfonate/bicarbonate transport system ATPase subunit